MMIVALLEKNTDQHANSIAVVPNKKIGKMENIGSKQAYLFFHE